MKRVSRGVLFLAGFVALLLSLPAAWTDGLRSLAVRTFSPIWTSASDLRGSDPKDQEIQRLLVENHLLGNDINHLKEIAEQEYFLLHQMLDEQQMKNLPKESIQALNRRQELLLNLFDLEMTNIPAKVIYRPLNSWNSSLWGRKGEADNALWGRQVIAKNSPVVCGMAVVGVVDYVGEHQSKVRLITDSGLNPSVRIKRGASLLAKGELKGESDPLFRSHRLLLKGVGFNYDFPDVEGPARDLRTGAPFDLSEKKKALPQALPLVQINDQLVTTGMDGVFPAGLEAGIVKKIYPLKEGDFSYDLDAEPAAKNLNNLNVVFILPRQSETE